MTARAQLATMIDAVPENDLPILLEVVRRFIPVDDIETPEDTAAHIQAMKEFKAGETVDFENIKWD